MAMRPATAVQGGKVPKSDPHRLEIRAPEKPGHGAQPKGAAIGPRAEKAGDVGHRQAPFQVADARPFHFDPGYSKICRPDFQKRKAHGSAEPGRCPPVSGAGARGHVVGRRAATGPWRGRDVPADRADGTGDGGAAFLAASAGARSDRSGRGPSSAAKLGAGVRRRRTADARHSRGAGRGGQGRNGDRRAAAFPGTAARIARAGPASAGRNEDGKAAFAGFARRSGRVRAVADAVTQGIARASPGHHQSQGGSCRKGMIAAPQQRPSFPSHMPEGGPDRRGPPIEESGSRGGGARDRVRNLRRCRNASPRDRRRRAMGRGQAHRAEADLRDVHRTGFAGVHAGRLHECAGQAPRRPAAPGTARQARFTIRSAGRMPAMPRPDVPSRPPAQPVPDLSRIADGPRARTRADDRPKAEEPHLPDI